jgi:uncharacterized protein GlcG (DUF336 family)
VSKAVFHFVRRRVLGGVGVSGIDHDDEPVAEAGAAAFKG